MSETSPSALTVLQEHELVLQQEVRRFADEQIRPLVHDADQQAKLPEEALKALFEMGLMGVEIPEELGGAGMEFFSAALVIEELARVDPAIAVVADVQNTLINNILLLKGNDAQKKEWCPQLAENTVGAFALSEADAGSDAFALKARAVADGDDYKISGNKMWITNGIEAGLYIVFANIDPDAGYKGITAFLVPRDAAGLTIGKKEDKLGIRASSTVELILEDVRVPKSAIIGEPGKGYKIAIEALNEGRIGIGAQMVGLAQGALDAAVAYAKERKQFGRSISEFQGVQFALAEMAIEVEAARLMVYNAGRLRDGGKPFVQEAAMAKWYTAEIAERTASRAVDLFGGYGFTKDYPVEKFYRDAKIGKIYEGTAFMQLNTVAKNLLK